MTSPCDTCELFPCVDEKEVPKVKRYCPFYRQRTKPMTNADRIRSMTDEELAEWMAINTDCFFCKVKNKNICSLDEGTCPEEWMSWLKSPAEVDNG